MRDIISDHAFFEHCLKDEYNKGYADAKKALEQESCDDAISRTDMLDAIGHGTTYTSEDLQRIIKALPSVTPKREQGEWIKGEPWSEGYGMGETYGYYYTCSKCGNLVQGDYNACDMKYCPNCGAEMR